MAPSSTHPSTTALVTAGGDAVAASTPRIPLDSPLALFAPEHYLASPVPAPLYLFEFVPGTLAHFYATHPDGTLRHQDDYFHERTIAYATGAAIHVQAVGSPRHGLPMQHDADIMLALLRMVDQGAVRDDGTFIQPSYRAILRAARRDTAGGEVIPAVKRALARWTVTVHTEASIDFRDLALRIGAGEARPRTPPGSPERATRTTAYSVLEYSFDTEVRKDHAVDTINHLRINPVWLSQAKAGIAAWIDVDVHNALRSPWAKRIYQHLAARAALGWRPQELLALTLPDFLQALAVRVGRRPAEDAAHVRTALDALQAQGVVAHGLLRPLKKGLYELVIEGGERLIGASHLRGTGSTERPLTRLLLAHLRAYGVNDKDGVELIAKSPAQVLSVLRRLHWLNTTTPTDRGGIKAATHPAKFIKSAVAGDYLFEEPTYQRWLADRSKAALEPAPIAARSLRITTALPSEAPSLGSAPLQYPDDLWGRALENLVDHGTITEGAARSFLLPTCLMAVADGTVTVQAIDTFTADWILKKYLGVLTDALAVQLGEPVKLTVLPRSGSRSPT